MKLLVAFFIVGVLSTVQAARPFESIIQQVTDDGGDSVLQENIITAVNSDLSATWVAGENERLEGFTVDDLKVLCGSKAGDPSVPPLPKPVTLKRSHSPNIDLPKNFDPRDKWPECSSLSAIRDQGHCGSCWAFGAVEVLTDRFCIAGHENVTLSTNDLLSCCGFECGDGCDGGWPERAWEYFERSGVVSEQCDPYFDTKPCKHPGCGPVMPTPKCVRGCKDDEFWGDSKHYAANVYTVGPDVEEIQKELYTNGPVEVAFTVYQDFAHYKSGVYKHIYGGVLGGHAVKLMGWGTTEDGVDYWLIANSWGYGWGEDGFFRIVRGENECGIESEAVAGLPAIKKVVVV